MPIFLTSRTLFNCSSRFQFSGLGSPTEQFLEQDMSVKEIKDLIDIKLDMMLFFPEDKAALIDDIKKLRSRLIEAA